MTLVKNDNPKPTKTTKIITVAMKMKQLYLDVQRFDLSSFMTVYHDGTLHIMCLVVQCVKM